MFFFFNDTATTEIYTLSLHDALPICERLLQEGERERRLVARLVDEVRRAVDVVGLVVDVPGEHAPVRSEEHTSELQSRQYLVCRLLLEKKPYSNPAPL